MPRRILIRLLTALALLATVIASPVGAEAGPRIDGRYFGVVDNSVADGDFPSVAFGSVSLMGSSYWRELEPRRGKFDFARLDAQVATVRRNKARPMLVLGLAPRFHSTRPRRADYSAAMPKMRAWKRYVRKVARRYGSRIDYQVWPEPNIISNFTGTPRQLARLQRAAYRQIKRVAPKAKVAGPAFVLRLPGQQRWMELFYTQRFNGKPIGRWLDIVPVDPYPPQSGTPEQSMKLIGVARRIARHAGARKPIWTVEINYGVAGGGQSLGSRFPRNKQISYVLRTYALSADQGVKRVYWLGWGHFQTMAIALTSPNRRHISAAGRALGRGRDWMLGYRHQGCARARNSVWTCTLVGRTGGRKETRRIMWRVGGARYVKAPRRSFKVHGGTGGSRKIRAGQPIKITSVPRLIRSRR